jgi:phosphatidylinositol glycan class W
MAVVDFAELKYLKEIRESHPSWLSSEDSVLDVAITTLIGPLCLLLRSFVRSKLNPGTNLGQFILDCLCIMGPIIISFTYLSSSVFRLLVVIVVIIQCLAKASEAQPIVSINQKYPLQAFGMPFLNTYRALVNLCTIIVILAVDFPLIFPQRFHKRYTNGFSLMDTGVGSFIFSHAIVAPESRYKTIVESRITRVKRCLVSSSMLIALGFGRLFVTWLTNYSVSEEEYGKHWNFFFTLACVKLITTVIYCVLPKSATSFSWVLASIIGVAYQCLLSLADFKDWIIVGDNKDGTYTGGFVHSNRPGVFSSIGYCSLYMFGVQVGQLIFKEKSRWIDHAKCVEKLALIASSCGFFTWLLHAQIGKSSRMIANLTFVIWQITHNTILLLSSYIADLICAIYSTPEKPIIPGQCESCSDRKRSSNCCCLLSAINKNQLFFFLIGNVMTGLVNLAIKTGSVEAILALAALFAYGSTVCGLTCILFVYNVSTKFW